MLSVYMCVIGAQQVIPMSVLPPADQPRHAVDSHSSVISQQTVGDSQRMVAMASATASSSVPVTSVAVASTKTQGREKLQY